MKTFDNHVYDNERLVSKYDKQALAEDGVIGGGAPTNAVGGGAIAGIGVGPQGEPGVKKKKLATFISYMNSRGPKLA